MLTCPCCGITADEFEPFGLHPRPNARCPSCGALERHRLLWLYFRDRTNLFTDRLSVLHVAPEAEIQRALRALPKLQYLSADLDSPLADERIDITDIPRPDGSFDVILCSHVLEHIPDDGRALAEMHRVLRPGGWAVLQSPIDGAREVTFEDPSVADPAERERLFGQHDHVRVYGRDYEARLAGGGFTVEVDDYAWRLPPDLIARHALLPEPIFIGRKKASPQEAPAT